jgi:hypothetical protein
MHTIINPGDGWELELLSDDSDGKDNSSTLDERLKGCSFIKEVKENKKYVAEIRYEERVHNQLVFVEAIVFKENGSYSGQNTLKDLEYFKRKGFEGEKCKADAAIYTLKLKEEIHSSYFSS